VNPTNLKSCKEEKDENTRRKNEVISNQEERMMKEVMSMLLYCRSMSFFQTKINPSMDADLGSMSKTS
jgi:hypothetical protein